jgi:hypothetical protein
VRLVPIPDGNNGMVPLEEAVGAITGIQTAGAVEEAIREVVEEEAIREAVEEEAIREVVAAIRVVVTEEDRVIVDEETRVFCGVNADKILDTISKWPGRSANDFLVMPSPDLR